MGKATLVIMAAGIGSRFGGGIKQLEAIGPNGEIIMDYSVYDAVQAGFDKVVFVIRKDLEKDFKEVIGNRIEQIIKVQYAFQEVDNIPERYKDKFCGRTKPWGTGQAILCCKELVEEPFLVINADDYYGKSAYKKAYAFLSSLNEKQDTLSIGMVGFELGNTLSENGGVTRGVCKVDSEHMLVDISETYNIIKSIDKAVSADCDNGMRLELDTPVSMNMWGLIPRFIDELETGFGVFLDQTSENDLKREYLLPAIIGDLLKAEKVEVEVLNSADKWFGVTYKEDKKSVQSAVQYLIKQGIYPEKLC